MPRTSTTWRRGCASPNPGGRPKALHDVQELARQHTEAAIETLAKLMADDKVPASARISAAEALLQRGWGRPVATVAAEPGLSHDEWIAMVLGETDDHSADDALSGAPDLVSVT